MKQSIINFFKNNWLKILIVVICFFISTFFFSYLISLISLWFQKKQTNFIGIIKNLNNLYIWLISFLLTLSLAIYFLYLFVFSKQNNKTKQMNEEIKIKNKSKKEMKNIKSISKLQLNKNIGLPVESLSKHTLLVGATGSGKTTTLIKLIKELIFKTNQPIIIIDGKGDKDLINTIKDIDHNAFIWTIAGKNSYNPFNTKESTILTDKIMSLLNFSEIYYQKIANHYLFLVIEVLLKNELNINLENLITYFDLKKNFKDIDNATFLKLNEFKEKDLKLIYSQLCLLELNYKNSISEINSLSELLSKHKIILFSLDSMSYPSIASFTGKLIIQDIKELLTLKEKEQKINLFLDEFNIFASETFINLINKARSFNLNCFLSFQTKEDLKINERNLADTIFGNVANIICQQLQDPNTAEYLAKIFGTKLVKEHTRQIDYNTLSTDKGSIRTVNEYIAHPDALKGLQIGEAYVKILLPSSKKYIAKIKIEN